jgi:hypothetical protein
MFTLELIYTIRLTPDARLIRKEIVSMSMTTELQHAFSKIGAVLTDQTFGPGFQIDIVKLGLGEAYELQRPWHDELCVEVMDVHPRLRHLVLDVTGSGLPISGRYLCGHDESHWFVAGLEFSRETAKVRGAMESLKPDIVRREQRRKGVKHRRHRRHTAAYVRQGEWFFLPRPNVHVVARLVEYDGRLVRGAGKPHLVDEVYRVPATDETYVRGRVQHLDHQTIHLDVWHQVVQNTEVVPNTVDEYAEELARIAWLD